MTLETVARTTGCFFSWPCIEFLGMHCPQEYVSVLYLASNRASHTLRRRRLHHSLGEGASEKCDFSFDQNEIQDGDTPLQILFMQRLFVCASQCRDYRTLTAKDTVDAAGDLTDSWQQSLFLSHIWEVGSLKAKGSADPMTHFNNKEHSAALEVEKPGAALVVLKCISGWITCSGDMLGL